MKIDDLYWMFSTIAQTLGAIVGIIGMLSVYKLQVISNSMNNVISQNARFLFDYFGVESYSLYPEIITEKLERHKEGHKISSSDQKIFDRMTTRINQSLKARENIKSDIPKFITSNVLIIFFSILAIPCSKWLADETILVPLSLVIVASLLLGSVIPTINLGRSLISES